MSEIIADSDLNDATDSKTKKMKVGRLSTVQNQSRVVNEEDPNTKDPDTLTDRRVGRMTLRYRV